MTVVVADTRRVVMALTSTMKGYGRAARFKAEAMGHQMKDRVLEKRLDRATTEADRLRFENEILRDEMEDARTEHRRILDMLDERLPEHSEDGEHSHKGRWLLFLAAVASAGYALYRRFQQDEEEWDASTDVATGGTTPSIRRDPAVA
jgi:hypothetical protein